jgi:hypothetical protein
MTRPKRTGWIVTALLLVVVVFVFATTASACPTCKNGLMEPDEASQRLLRGYFWSILFMMSMPFAILFGIGGYMYREVKRAQTKAAANAAAEVIAAKVTAEASQPASEPACELASSAR